MFGLPFNWQLIDGNIFGHIQKLAGFAATGNFSLPLEAPVTMIIGLVIIDSGGK